MQRDLFPSLMGQEGVRFILRTEALDDVVEWLRNARVPVNFEYGLFFSEDGNFFHGFEVVVPQDDAALFKLFFG